MILGRKSDKITVNVVNVITIRLSGKSAAISGMVGFLAQGR